jgi:phage shock protein A
MSVSDMKKYVKNRDAGPATARDQVALLTAQRDRLADEAARLVVRQRYVQLKIDYWLAIDAGDTDLANRFAGEARSLTDQLKPAKA